MNINPPGPESAKRNRLFHLHCADYFLGQSVVDQMTYVLGNVLRAPAFMAGGGATMADLVRALKAEERRVIHSTVSE